MIQYSACAGQDQEAGFNFQQEGARTRRVSGGEFGGLGKQPAQSTDAQSWWMDDGKTMLAPGRSSIMDSRANGSKHADVLRW
jgi:hypothetical protein